MNPDKKSGLGGSLSGFLTWAAFVYLALWVVAWLLQRRWGLWVVLTAIITFGSALVISGLVNTVSWDFFDSDYTLGGQSWFWTACFIGSSLFSLISVRSIKD